MTCKCGYQNPADSKYCGGCGRKLHRGEGISKKMLAVAAVCLLITGIGIGNLLSGLAHSAGETEQQNSPRDQIVKKDVEIAQVLPMEDGSVAVLYTDGTVRASENSPFSGMVSSWSDVEKLYYNVSYEWTGGEMLEYPALFGLSRDGSVLRTDGKPSGWSNVKELHFTWQGIVGVTYDGNVLADGDWEDPSFLTDLTDVEHLVYSDIQDIWGCLRKNGSVTLHGDYVDSDLVRWSNVKELRSSDHSFYVIRNDGTVDGGAEEDNSGLDGAVKVVDFTDWLFGISADGRLLTCNGGNIYTNTGDMMVDAPGSLDYGGEVDIRQFDQVRDIVPFRGLILLNEDGTAEHVGVYPHWDLSTWDNTQKICGRYADEGFLNLYGIQQDGSVVVNQYDWNQDAQTVTNHYHGWKLRDIYAGNNGVVGLTADGKLVGDGIYEAVDFSVFDR